MSSVGIVTDSTSVLPPELIAEYGIRIVPMGIVINNKVYRDNIDITTADFLKMFPDLKEMPTTSAGGQGDFYNTFNDLARDTESIVCVTMSRVLSATWGGADQAAKMAMEKNPGLDVKVIDSKTCLGALGLTVLEAARAAKTGKSQAEVLAVIQDMIPRVKYFMILETLKYLMKIGRAPGGQAPDIPQIKPIMGMVSGKGVVENLDRAATMDEALLKAAGMVKNYVDTSKPVHFLLTYPETIGKCEQLKKVLADKYNCAEIYMAQCTPTTSFATGRMYALGFYT